jgi:DNA transformation protein
LRVSESFRLFVLEQLAGIDHLHARAMFGGVGLYAAELFFGILAADTLYFKVDDSNRPAYEAAGMKAFQPYTNGAMSMSYYQVPAAVIEDPAELAAWASAAIRAAKGRQTATRQRQKRR